MENMIGTAEAQSSRPPPPPSKGSGIKDWIRAQKNRKKHEDAPSSCEDSAAEVSPKVVIGQRVQHKSWRAEGATLSGIVMHVDEGQDGHQSVGVNWVGGKLRSVPEIVEFVADDETSYPPWFREKWISNQGNSTTHETEGKSWSIVPESSLCKECSFESALRRKYVDTMVRGVFGQPVALGMLKSIELRCAGISSLLDINPSELPKLIEVDLSCNMLRSYKEIADFVQQFTSLRSLNISENWLDPDSAPVSNSDSTPSVGVENVVMNRIPAVDWTVLQRFLSNAGILPLELSLSHNSLDHIRRDVLPLLKNARVLRLESNAIKSWAALVELAALPHLSALILSGNPLEDVWYPDAAPPADSWPSMPFACLHSISLSDSGLCSWAHVDALARFPSLREARLQNIPLLDGVDPDTARMLLISHLPNVCAGGQGRQTVGSETCGRLNGGMVTATERRDAHRFYLEYYASRSPSHRPVRYQQLLQEEPLLSRLCEEGAESHGDQAAMEAGQRETEAEAPALQDSANFVLHNGAQMSSFDARGLGRCL